jgi:hypothetical protein
MFSARGRGVAEDFLRASGTLFERTGPDEREDGSIGAIPSPPLIVPNPRVCLRSTGYSEGSSGRVQLFAQFSPSHVLKLDPYSLQEIQPTREIVPLKRELFPFLYSLAQASAACSKYQRCFKTNAPVGGTFPVP